MSSMSTLNVTSSESYLGLSKFSCYCGECADLWRSRTTDNPGRLFLKCGMVKRCRYWKWEDEISGTQPRDSQRKMRGGQLDRNLEVAGSAELRQIRADLLVMRYALVVVALALVWIAARA